MITIADWFGYDIPHRERYRMIKNAGFEGILLFWSEVFGHSDYKNAPDQIRNAGLFVENIHAPFSGANNLWLDNLDGEGITDYLLQCVNDCRDHQIPTMIVHLTSGDNPPPATALGVDRIHKIIGHAEKLNINIALENLRRPDYLKAVFDKVDSNRLGFCYDSGHHNWRSAQTDLLAMYGDKLMALHLHDNDGTSDQHRLPFDGSIDWSALMKKLAESHYTSPIALEVTNFGHEDMQSEVFLALAFERAKELEALL